MGHHLGLPPRPQTRLAVGTSPARRWRSPTRTARRGIDEGHRRTTRPHTDVAVSPVEARGGRLRLMFDEAYGPPPGLATEGAGGPALQHGRWQSSTVSSHPWTHCAANDPPMGRPLYAAVDRRGYSGVRRHRTTSTLSGCRRCCLISGFTRNHVRMSADMGAFDPERASRTDHYTTVLSQVIDADRYPNLSLGRERLPTTAASTSSTRLRFGLDLILDGVAARSSTKRRYRRRAPRRLNVARIGSGRPDCRCRRAGSGIDDVDVAALGR